MPNSGMLDHPGFRPGPEERVKRAYYVHWMGAWPSNIGYQTPRTFKVSEFSRHMIKETKKELNFQRQISRPHTVPGPTGGSTENSIAPFHTITKPTCGYFFSPYTDNKKRLIGIAPVNTVAWRSIRAPLRIWPQALARLSTQLCPLNPANGMEEALMDFTCEAQAVLKEVSYAIAEGILSQKLESSNTCAHINLTTKEGKEMTVRLSGRGFEVVGHSYDNTSLEVNNTIGTAFETIYALLQSISPSYQQSFHDAVAHKLQAESGTA